LSAFYFAISKKNCIFAVVIKIANKMVAVRLEYNNNNAVLIGILDAVSKMPDVKLMPIEKETEEMSTNMFSHLSLSEQAKVLNQSINTDVPMMTMEEIVQEIRDYRNGK
jgi:hypothetical protein